MKDAVHQASFHPVSLPSVLCRESVIAQPLLKCRKICHHFIECQYCVIVSLKSVVFECHWRDAIKCHHLFVINLSSSVIVVIFECHRFIIECHYCHPRVSSTYHRVSVLSLFECHRLIIECQYCHYSNVINVSSFERNHWKWQPNWKASSMELVKTSLSF